MSHDPELLAAQYLDHMPEPARGDFEAHLLTCDGCWREISLAREGREIAKPKVPFPSRTSRPPQ